MIKKILTWAIPIILSILLAILVFYLIQMYTKKKLATRYVESMISALEDNLIKKVQNGENIGYEYDVGDYHFKLNSNGKVYQVYKVTKKSTHSEEDFNIFDGLSEENKNLILEKFKK